MECLIKEMDAGERVEEMNRKKGESAHTYGTELGMTSSRKCRWRS